ncbi:MAG: protein translocase subunit SecD [Lentisphaerae bacterium]|nr:protein translocase subunit SecD [Lentisphaerota bacterium]
MKRSLVWRWVLTIGVLAGWVAALFPLRDRDFMVTFERLAKAGVSKLEAKAEATQAAAASSQAALEAIKDTASDAYKAQESSHLRVKAEADAAAAALKAYQDMLARAEAMRQENPELAQYRSIEQASRGDETHARVRLSDVISVPGLPTASNKRVIKFVRDKAAGKLRLGLDLQGGTEFVISFSEDEAKAKEKDIVQVRDQIIEILRNRLDMMGLVEPEIKPVGNNTISVRMPTLSEGAKSDIREVLKQQANLQFYLVDPNNDAKVAEYRANPSSFRPSPGFRYAELESERDGEVITDVIFIKKTAEALDGGEVSRAQPVPSQFGNWWSISLEFKGRGARQFARITTDNVNERLAIVMDGKVYSAPNINEPITGGQAEITGNFGFEEARRLAGVIESGNLPVNIQIDSEFGTDPTLGADSVRSGIWAGLAGLAMVVVFMIGYYRLAGVIAVVALLMNTALTLGTMTLLRATITMPGIAGMILTIGMAVDANVLIFERIREELRNGKTIGNAIESGYARAFVTIFDSNITTLLTAVILYNAGTGSVRGFAVTLGIGIVASMFTAIFVTRVIFDTMLSRGTMKTLRMNALRWFTDCNYDILAWTKPAITISVILCVVALIAGIGRGRSALSIDFSGGTEVGYEVLGTEPPVAAVRDALVGLGHPAARVGYKFSGAAGLRMLEIVLPRTATDATDSLDLGAIEEALTQKFPEAKLKQVQTNSVGNLVGAQFQMRAFLATLLSFLGIVLYVSFRFELAYGIAAVVALVHDVLVAGGLYLLFGWFTGGRQISLTVVAALLTIIGYSINDTIVTFDRVRESLALQREKTYKEIINLSINQTLSRTFLTSFTTLMPVVTLLIFGGGTINDFALVMTIGVIVGTYSTVFVASAIIQAWHKPNRAHRDEVVGKARVAAVVETEVAATKAAKSA